MEELKSEIHRYYYKDIKILVQDIYKDMEKDKESETIYTISLVNNDQLHKLPNINVSNINELEQFYKQNINNYQFQEIWFCKKKAEKGQVFSVGRISINTSRQTSNIVGLETGQIIEQVWNTNHRAIEKYTVLENIAYLRASRIDWARRYSIDKVQIPQESNIYKEQMIQQFTEAVKNIEQQMEKIESMSQYLSEMGINSFSLEYLLEGNKFLFIDWDSQNDIKVINQLIKDNNITKQEGMEK